MLGTFWEGTVKKDIRLAVCIVVIILLVILCIFVLLSEKEKEDDLNDPSNIENMAVPTPRLIVVPSSGTNDPVFLKSIKYYVVKLSDMSIDTAEEAVGNGVAATPEMICEYVSTALEDEEINIDIRKITVADNICKIDFNEEIRSIAKRNHELEKLILDAYAMSIIDNCEGVDAVTFTISGEDYSTGSVSLPGGKVYLKK